MSRISDGISFRPGAITNLLLDVGFERYWVRGVQLDRVIIGDEEKLYIVDTGTRARLKDISIREENNSNCLIGNYRWFLGKENGKEDNLLLIQENRTDDSSGEKITESYLYEVNMDSKYFFRIPFIYIEYGYPPHIGSDLIYNENSETYKNILGYLGTVREDDTRDLFVKVNGVYRSFLDSVVDIIKSI